MSPQIVTGVLTTTTVGSSSKISIAYRKMRGIQAAAREFGKRKNAAAQFCPRGFGQRISLSGTLKTNIGIPGHGDVSTTIEQNKSSFLRERIVD
jgi:hypothetical protein